MYSRLIPLLFYCFQNYFFDGCCCGAQLYFRNANDFGSKLSRLVKINEQVNETILIFNNSNEEFRFRI